MSPGKEPIVAKMFFQKIYKRAQIIQYLSELQLTVRPKTNKLSRNTKSIVIEYANPGGHIDGPEEGDLLVFSNTLNRRKWVRRAICHDSETLKLNTQLKIKTLVDNNIVFC